MSLSNTFKSFSLLAALTVFALSIVAMPSTSAATSGGVSPPATSEQQPEGKCANNNNPADKSKCLKELIKKQREHCQELKAKKQTAKAQACVKTVNNQIERLKATNERLKVQIAAAKKISLPKDYQECLAKVAPIDDTSDMRDKINKSYNNRTKVLANLQKRVDKLANEGAKTAMTDALTSDKAILDFYKAGSTQTDSPSALQAMYCQSIFRLQINNFRKTQINMVKNVDAQLKYDQARNSLFTNQYNQPAKVGDNMFASQINSRLDAARTMTTANLTNVATAYLQTVGAKVAQTGEGASMNYTSDLATPKATIAQAKKDRVTAMRNYNEAQVLRGLGNDKGLTGDRAYTVTSITLKNSKGDVIGANDKVALSDKTLESCQVKVDNADNPNKTATATAKQVTAKELKECREKLKKNTQPRKATVVVKAGGKEYTKQLTRSDKISTWKVQN